MAVVPSLQLLAAYTLFHNPEHGAGAVDNYCLPYTAPAITIQKTVRSYLARARALLGQLQWEWVGVSTSGRWIRAGSTALRQGGSTNVGGPPSTTPILDSRALRMHGERRYYSYHKVNSDAYRARLRVFMNARVPLYD